MVVKIGKITKKGCQFCLKYVLNVWEMRYCSWLVSMVVYACIYTIDLCGLSVDLFL